MRQFVFTVFILAFFSLPMMLSAQQMPPAEKKDRPFPPKAVCSENRGAPQCRPGSAHFDAVLERLKKTRPEEYTRLQQLRISDRKEFFRQMRALMPPDSRHRFYAEFRKLEKEQRELAEKYQAAGSPQEKERLLQLLRKSIDDHQELILHDMKNRITRMQKKIAQMEKNSGKIKEQKLQRLLKKSAAPQKVNRR